MTFSITRTLHRIISLRNRKKFLLELRRNQWKRKDELEKIQLNRLRAILRHAYRYVPYYHKLFKSVKFKPEEIKDLDDLRKIPITTKLDVKNMSQTS